jgi:hypothetical protein
MLIYTYEEGNNETHQILFERGEKIEMGMGIEWSR